MSLRLPLLLLLALATPLLGGCSVTTSTSVYELDLPPETYLLAVDVENFNGSVEIRAERPGKPVVVKGEVRSDTWNSHSYQDAADEAVEIDAEIDEIDGLAILRVRTSTRREAPDHSVKLHITVPRADGVRIVNQGGLVEVVGSAGATHIENRKGSIELRTRHPMVEDVVLLAVDGNIYYQVPFGSTGQFDLETLEGRSIFRDFSGETDGTFSGSLLQIGTQLGDGGNMVVAKTNRGDVRAWVMEDPIELTRMFHIRQYDMRDHIFTDGSKRYRRNLPDDEPRE